MSRDLAKIILTIVLAMALSLWAMPLILEPEFADRGEWRIHKVDYSGNTGWSTSLGLDSEENPHIAYWDRIDNDLEYAKWTGCEWQLETVDSENDVGEFVSLAMDSFDHPHISYFDETNGNLKYATWAGDNWTIETVDSFGNVGQRTSIAIDSSDYPHVSYLNLSSNDLKYANWTGDNWNIETVDTGSVVDQYTSIGLDSGDNPHISYHKEGLAHANWTGSSWNIEVVDSPGAFGYSSLAIDRNDYPHISYYTMMPNDLKYARWNGSAWNIETVDSGHMVGIATSIALDSNDYPHISYHKATHLHYALKYANWNGTSWIIEEVEFSEKTVGWATSIAIDRDDLPHMSYWGYALKYASKAELTSLPGPLLNYSPSTIDFGSLPQGMNQSRTIEIWNSGNCTLTYSLSENSSWVTSIDPPNGSVTCEHDNIILVIDTNGLSPGPYATSVWITSNGGNESLTVSVNVLPPPPPMVLDIDPDTLNLKSKGRWITAYIYGEKARVEDIDASSILLNDEVSPAWWGIQNDVTLMVKFDRAATQAVVSVSNSVDIKVTGQWRDGESFELHDTIRVINPG